MNREAKLKAIRERLSRATPGPWFCEPKFLAVLTEDGLTRARAKCDADAEFIAHAPDDVAYLLDALKEAREERDRAVEQLREWYVGSEREVSLPGRTRAFLSDFEDRGTE